MQDVVSAAAGDSDSAAVWVYDPRSILLTRFTEFSFSSPRFRDHRILPLGERGSNPALWPHWFGDHRLLLADWGDSLVFRVVDVSGHVLRERGVSPPGPDSLPVTVRRQAVSGSSLCVRADAAEFTMYFRYAGRLVQYDSALQRVREVSVPFPSSERFEVRKSGDAALAKERFFYMGCSYGGQNVYALFSGKARRPTDRVIDSQAIHVFDAGGNLIRLIVLSIPVSAIAVDRNATTMFATSWNSALVYRMRLSR
jgi:hypothetical protein